MRLSETTNNTGSVGVLSAALAGLCLGLLSACEPPPPRSYSEYLEDDVAREATLERCNLDRVASFSDLECKNARRAAAALAAQAEASHRAELERESDRKRAAARERIAAQQEAARRAEEAAEAAHQVELLYGGTKLDPLSPSQEDMPTVPAGQDPRPVETVSIPMPAEGSAPLLHNDQDERPQSVPLIAPPPQPAAVMPAEQSSAEPEASSLAPASQAVAPPEIG
jgi:hypothetical protein